MATKFKCTKIVVGGLPAAGSNEVGCQVYYVDPTTNPPTPYSSYRSVLKTEAENPTDLKTDLDVAVATDQGGDTMDWTL